MLATLPHFVDLLACLHICQSQFHLAAKILLKRKELFFHSPTIFHQVSNIVTVPIFKSSLCNALQFMCVCETVREGGRYQARLIWVCPWVWARLACVTTNQLRRTCDKRGVGGVWISITEMKRKKYLISPRKKIHQFFSLPLPVWSFSSKILFLGILF